ncbi:hypothetical protein [Pyxidicoccus xibeiensis]|uniref:hypothetical protein n=1 Tax=Pyxidicoccus xibeiensis TaxID=2906759 RepID=UPI0020A7D477|nr:hypothetical protein [Pyxidicoccus xibeiensis]MCP3144645.1 hypothetical protein [Pyxidicoccus xibeiensis]
MSCTGATCSSTDYQGVTCDGAFTACPSTTSCSGLPLCSSLENRTCLNLGATQSCCRRNRTDILVCSPTGGSGTEGKWLYY